MEVFLSNVPVDLSDRSLHTQLTPYMNALGILDWQCTKNRAQKTAFIAFLDKSDGHKFLQRHGKVAGAGPVANPLSAHRIAGRRDLARLTLMRCHVYASLRNEAPDPFLIKSLQMRQGVRLRNGKAPEDDTHQDMVFEASGLACGHLSLVNPTKSLTFVEQCWFDAPGHVRFANKTLLARFPDSAVILHFAYETITHLIHDSKAATLTAVLREAPRIFLSNSLDDSMAALDVRGGSRSRYRVLDRYTYIPAMRHHQKYVASCLVYQFACESKHFIRLVSQLRHRQLFPMVHEDLPLTREPTKYLEDFETANLRFQANLSECERKRIVPFRLLFLTQALASNNYLHPHVADSLLFCIRQAFSTARITQQPHDPVSAEAMKSLYQDIPYPYPGMEPSDLDPVALMAHLLKKEARTRKEAAMTAFKHTSNKNYAWVFKANVTPTRITLHGPAYEPMNRILRKFPDHAEYFMRVQFCDENGDDIFLSAKVSNDHIYNRFRRVLQSGIQIAGRVYSFLGFSHSSLRSHSAWFSAPFVDKTGQLQSYVNIIKSLGDFEHIRIPAKCAARIGQAFSETTSSVSLVDHGIVCQFIPDVKYGNRVFSDGVGTISRDALETIWPHLPRMESLPTCLQIRWGGVKGMLSLDSRLPGRVMNIRQESMLKFPSTDLDNLGICGAASRPLRMVLNRQMIKILEDMGVRDEWFFSLQKRELERLRAVTADAWNTGAFLQLQGIGSAFYLSTFIKTLDKYGINYRRDDFLRCIVEAVVLRELRLLKHKARIPVPQGVTLFGIMDETGFLSEGEVYVCYDSRYNGSLPIDSTLSDGNILVTRSPALHPGDIQWVRMRTPPVGHPLRDLRNCIVFSQHGERDLPSQLSGGDLDGDLYNIIWDRQARPKRFFAPADYPRITPTELNRQVTRDDMAGFFVDFMKSDVLGMIATKHLILADQKEEGTLDADCIIFAEMHSTAVDFSKTGIPVDMQAMPKTNRIRPDFFAPAPPTQYVGRQQIDFVEKPSASFYGGEDEEEDAFRPAHKFYRSGKILGRLYRNIDEKRMWDQDVRRPVTTEGPTVWEQFIGMMEKKLSEHAPGVGRISWEHWKAEAWALRNMYEDAVHNAMYEYSDSHLRMLTEVEVFCGFIFSKTGAQTRRQADNSKKLKETFERVSETLVANIRQRTRETEEDAQPMPPGSASTSSVDDPLERALAPNLRALEFSWACLQVGLEDDEHDNRATMQSFKIIAASCFLKEVTEFINRLMNGKVASTATASGIGGGFVGVNGRSHDPTLFPQYGANPYNFDAGHLTNYGFTQYL
ncbi:hypothetical protein VD0004_g8035 [Verticillium dahliae]|nr:hypothetical protein VD0004_g8035 [Verticillium dahliae]PNH76398.1 hypothetical protein VD0001_g1220 [Verticillium dahliae]